MQETSTKTESQQSSLAD